MQTYSHPTLWPRPIQGDTPVVHLPLRSRSTKRYYQALGRYLRTIGTFHDGRYYSQSAEQEVF